MNVITLKCPKDIYVPNGEKYLTKDKLYQAKEGFMGLYEIYDDSDTRICISLFFCPHLNGDKWEIVK